MALTKPYKFMKKVFYILVVLLLALNVYANFGQIKEKVGELFGGSYSRLVTLVGTTGDAEKLPANVYVMANATNTDPTYDGGTVTQRIVTTGVETVRLNFKAVGSVSTSTVDVRLMASYDSVDYYDMMYSTSTPNLAGNGTTTPSIAPYVTTWVPGTATTSWSYDYDVTGTNYVRFLLKSNDTGDLNIGAQAFIQAIAIDEF